MRVYELAKVLNTDSRRLKEALCDLGMPTKSPSSQIDVEETPLFVESLEIMIRDRRWSREALVILRIHNAEAADPHQIGMWEAGARLAQRADFEADAMKDE